MVQIKQGMGTPQLILLETAASATAQALGALRLLDTQYDMAAAKKLADEVREMHNRIVELRDL